MKLFKIIKRETTKNTSNLVLAIFLGGISQMLLVEILHNAAEQASVASISIRHFLLLGCCISLYLFAQKYVSDKSCEIVEQAIVKIRCRIANKIRKTELSTLEAIGSASLYARLTQDALYISNTASMTINNLQAFFMMLFMLFYLCWLSPSVFFLVFLSLLLGVISYARYSEIYAHNWRLLSKRETAFFEKFSHVLSGFKEIRINETKSNEVYADYVKVNKEKLDIRVKTTQLYNVNKLFAAGFFFLAIIGVLVILPHFQEITSGDMLKIIATLLFIFGPYQSVIAGVSIFALADNSAKNIWELEEQLNQKLKFQKKSFNPTEGNTALPPLRLKGALHLKGLMFQYKNKDGVDNFSIGPIDLKIDKGEIIFVTGGNGSGKSTFMKLLTGLYLPKGGVIYLQESSEAKEIKTYITPHNYQQYRELFTTIFTDFHLFDKLYGLKDINPLEVKQLLQEMELPKEKTTYRNRAFTNIKLSSGQRKRLALINAILEDKDIYILDEVAADLDPWFRDVYYYKILTKLKAKGKTVFVISHDRKYWEIADRILHLENGQVKEIAQKDFQNYIDNADKTAKSMMFSSRKNGNTANS